MIAPPFILHFLTICVCMCWSTLNLCNLSILRELKMRTDIFFFHYFFFYLCVSGSNFVTRKISRSVAKIHLGQQECFSLGNMDSMRDWGHARDYVEVKHIHNQNHTQALEK